MCKVKNCLELRDLEGRLNTWYEDRDYRIDEYVTERKIAQNYTKNDDGVLENCVMYSFGIKNKDNVHDMVMIESIKTGEDVDILLFFNVDENDVLSTRLSDKTKCIAVNVKDLCLRKDDEMLELDEIISLYEKGGSTGWSRKSVALALRMLLQRFVRHMSGKRKELEIIVPLRSEIMLDIAKTSGAYVNRVKDALNNDLSKLENARDIICMPVIDYYHCEGVEYETTLGVLPVEHLFKLYAMYKDLVDNGNNTDAEELLSLADNVLNDYYAHYYPNVKELLPNALLGFIFIATLYMLDDYTLYNNIRRNVTK